MSRVLPKKQTKDTQDSEFCLFFGRIKDIIICFGDLLTSRRKFQKHQELGGEGGLFNSWLSEPGKGHLKKFHSLALLSVNIER